MYISIQVAGSRAETVGIRRQVCKHEAIIEIIDIQKSGLFFAVSLQMNYIDFLHKINLNYISGSMLLL